MRDIVRKRKKRKQKGKKKKRKKRKEKIIGLSKSLILEQTDL